MASSPSFLFADTGMANDKKKKESVKPLENPLLGRNPPPLRNENTPSNNGSLRQRRPLAHSDKAAAAKKPTVIRPPRSSSSLGTGINGIPVDKTSAQSLKQRSTERGLLPSSSGCWIMVYGFSTTEQYEQVLERFRPHGHILDQRGSSGEARNSNWVALQFESRLQAEKAICHSTVQLSSHIFVGVKRLDDADPILSQASSGSLQELWGNSSSTSGAKRNLLTSEGGLKEIDILLCHKDDDPVAAAKIHQRSLCQRFLLWVFLLEDE